MLKRSGDILKALQETYDFIIDRTVMRKMGNVLAAIRTSKHSNNQGSFADHVAITLNEAPQTEQVEPPPKKRKPPTPEKKDLKDLYKPLLRIFSGNEQEILFTQTALFIELVGSK